MTFRRFMEMALYEPELGYYERAVIGREGDFQTNVSVGPLFGELLAWQFGEWLQEESGKGRTPMIVEAGAHDGRAAADILGALHVWSPSLAERVRYCVLDPSMKRRDWQRASLSKWENQICWIKDWEELEIAVTGIIFSNELLDALPFHRFAWNRAEWRWCEMGVNWEAGQFTWQRMPQNSVVYAPALPEGLHKVLPDGFLTEHCPAAEDWWSKAANALASGVVMTFDYGLDASEFFAPHRAQGTARGYYKHRQETDVLREPGEQDLTAHVNYTSIRQAGEKSGLVTLADDSQERFLTRVFLKLVKAAPVSEEWTAERSGAFQTLTHPDHFGRSFRVLAQSKTKS